MDYLPHRYPLLLVDRVTELEVDNFVAGYKNVTINEDFFTGHFPGRPIMPGVLIIEAMAQLSGLLAFKSKNKKHSDGVICYLAGTDKARFKRPVVPGDQLLMRSEFRADRRGVMKFHCQAHVGEELACSADITCMVMMQDDV